MRKKRGNNMKEMDRERELLKKGMVTELGRELKGKEKIGERD